MESVFSSSPDFDPEEALVERRAILTQAYHSLPRYASPAFWQALRHGDTPLELVVRCLRLALSLHDDQARATILDILFWRTYTVNQQWAQTALKGLFILFGEREAAVSDLCADLYEQLFKAVLDPERLFWEENFLHCLYFERKHVYRQFLAYEGYWKNAQVVKSDRVPRTLLERLEQPGALINENTAETGFEYDIVDEQASHMLEMIDNDQLLNLVLSLPESLKLIVLLKFWAGKSDDEVARVVGTSARSVRYRMVTATKLLRKHLVEEGVDG